jgi:hypothetical protein
MVPLLLGNGTLSVIGGAAFNLPRTMTTRKFGVIGWHRALVSPWSRQMVMGLPVDELLAAGPSATPGCPFPPEATADRERLRSQTTLSAGAWPGSCPLLMRQTPSGSGCHASEPPAPPASIVTLIRSIPSGRAVYTS